MASAARQDHAAAMAPAAPPVSAAAAPPAATQTTVTTASAARRPLSATDNAAHPVKSAAAAPAAIGASAATGCAQAVRYQDAASRRAATSTAIRIRDTAAPAARVLADPAVTAVKPAPATERHFHATSPRLSARSSASLADESRSAARYVRLLAQQCGFAEANAASEGSLANRRSRMTTDTVLPDSVRLRQLLRNHVQKQLPLVLRVSRPRLRASPLDIV
jgi:hypothetical protein